MRANANVVTGIVILLLLGFTLPAWVGLMALITGGLRGDAGLGRLFFLMLFQPSPVWDLIRTGLAVGIAGVAAANVANRLDVRANWVLGALIACFLPLAVLFLFLMDPEHGKELWQLVELDDADYQIQTTAAFDRGWSGFLTGQLQTLAAHVALFLGLQVRKD
ncbi:MAG: hypothetical protein EON87_07270 [Brevundimonas sp.]|nr:MAG: hypothetical protein EON87_07270 [Brevundimonas sp.]